MDARSLLRAKKAEARIAHPYASYSAAGQLRCTICAIPVKQWDAHLLTKQHRTSVAREKAIHAKSTKRSAAETLRSESKRTKTVQAHQAGATGADGEDDGPAGLPVGFFSAGNRPMPQEEEEVQAGPSAPSAPSVSDLPIASTEPRPPPPPPAKNTGDAELDSFLASLDEVDPFPSTNPTTTNIPPRRNVFQSTATVPGVASYEAAPVRNVSKQEEGQPEAVEPEETEAERRARVEREEREEIMGRLEEEERAQEDADSRVMALKQRMEMLKKRREARPTKPKATTDRPSVTNGA